VGKCGFVKGFKRTQTSSNSGPGNYQSLFGGISKINAWGGQVRTGKANKAQKITNEQKAEMKKIYLEGKTVTELSELYKVTQETVRRKLGCVYISKRDKYFKHS